MNRRILLASLAIAMVAIVVGYYVGVPYFYPAGHSLRLDLRKLPVLHQGHYEAWAIFGTEKVSTGKFQVTQNGAITTLSGAPITEFRSDRDLRSANAIAITIEPEGDNDNSPSGIIILIGQVSNGRSTLRFPLDLSGSKAQYVLATPTQGDKAPNQTSGVWFPDLKLPQAPSGWKYESWAVYNGRALSTGRFANPNAPDEFSGHSGSLPAPPIPGEDFLRNPPPGLTFPINLADGKSVIAITLEPDLNGVDPTGPEPFDLKPFVASVPLGAADHQPFMITLDLSGFPSGTVSIP